MVGVQANLIIIVGRATRRGGGVDPCLQLDLLRVRLQGRARISLMCPSRLNSAPSVRQLFPSSPALVRSIPATRLSPFSHTVR